MFFIEVSSQIEEFACLHVSGGREKRSAKPSLLVTHEVLVLRVPLLFLSFILLFHFLSLFLSFLIFFPLPFLSFFLFFFFFGKSAQCCGIGAVSKAGVRAHPLSLVKAPGRAAGMLQPQGTASPLPRCCATAASSRREATAIPRGCDSWGKWHHEAIWVRN